MGLDDSANHIQLPGAEAVIASEPERLQPKLAGSVLTLHMEVGWLVAIEAHEEEPIRPGNVLDSRHSSFGSLQYQHILTSGSVGCLTTWRSAAARFVRRRLQRPVKPA